MTTACSIAQMSGRQTEHAASPLTIHAAAVMQNPTSFLPGPDTQPNDVLQVTSSTDSR